MSDTSPDYSLFIERKFSAPIDEVWEAWTDPEILVQWFGPRDWPAVKVTQDVTKDGVWQAILRNDSDEELVVGGRYLLLQEPDLLSFTFQWQSDNHEDGPGVETLVEIKLSSCENGTLMKFKQSKLATEESASGHTDGWGSTFDRLQDLFAA